MLVISYIIVFHHHGLGHLHPKSSGYCGIHQNGHNGRGDGQENLKTTERYSKVMYNLAI